METIETKTVEQDGFTVTLRKVYDEDTKPYDYDCYDKADIEAWEHDEWRYVGVIASAERAGVTLAEDSLWGIEDGTWSDRKTVDAFEIHGQELAEQAVALAKEAIAKLVKS